jgi:predicted DNA repair protein MutK
MSRPSGLSLKWVLIGAAAILVLNDVMGLLLAGNVGASLIQSLGQPTGVYALIGIVAFGSFFVGGLLIGLFSPGETIREPALAAGIAVLINARMSFTKVDSHSFTFTDWMIGTLISVVLGLAMGLAGGWIGEKMQGDTGAKIRERSDLPPMSGDT